MFVWVCMHVRRAVCVSVCLPVCLCEYVCIWEERCVWVCACLCACVSMYACERVCVSWCNAHYCTMHMWFCNLGIVGIEASKNCEYHCPHASAFSDDRDSNRKEWCVWVCALTHTTHAYSTHTSTHRHTFSYTHHSLTCIHTHTSTQAGTHTLTAFSHAQTHSLTCIHTHTSTQAGTHSHTPLFSYAYILTQAHRQAHTHTHRSSHMHTYSHKHTLSVIYYGIWLLYLLANFANWRKTHAQICRNYFVSWTTIFSLVK